MKNCCKGAKGYSIDKKFLLFLLSIPISPFLPLIIFYIFFIQKDKDENL